MRIRNLTTIPVEAVLWQVVFQSKLETKGIKVKIVWMRETSQSAYSGSFLPHEGKINIRINKSIQYPYPLQVATGEWFENTDGSFFQIYKKILVDKPEQICAFAFARELSHLKDLQEGKNLKYRQTKADKLAYDICKSLGILVE